MRQLILILLCLTMISPALAAADDQQAVVAAAAANAVDCLHVDIAAESIRPDLTVKTFLDRTDSQPSLLAVLSQAQQIGGPRWIDAQTCQVRMDIPASVVREQLRQIAADHPQTTPIPPDDLMRDLKSWDARVFSATGTSTGEIDLIRPPPGSGFWQTISESEVRQSVEAARQNAADRLLASIAPVPLAGGKTVGDALAVGAVRQTMRDWIVSQPITLVEFQDDHQVQVTLAVSAAGMSEKLRSKLSGRSNLPLPADEQAWSMVAGGISQQMCAPVGYGGAIAAVASQPSPIALPDPPPDWIFQQLDASASASADSPLLAARAAELAATSNLRQQIEKLPLGQGKTVQDLADGYPRFAAAIDRTLARSAHVYSVDYLPDGSATVRESLNLQDLWQMLWLAR